MKRKAIKREPMNDQWIVISGRDRTFLAYKAREHGWKVLWTGNYQICMNRPLTKTQKAMLDFIRACPGWHSYANDYLTVKNANRLVELKLIEINEFSQFRSI
ncbi:hypothetical protein LCGC14_1000380 [marine sediment metagenome]|uniref:Uncharacterized protein n=1 Tax=marine sediment metagenome TaxID=412755 RepID=A0A0F9NPT3_9ZZZZ